MKLCAPTFLPLVEDGRARVVEALVVVVLVRLSAAFVDALLRHTFALVEAVARVWSLRLFSCSRSTVSRFGPRRRIFWKVAVRQSASGGRTRSLSVAVNELLSPSRCAFPRHLLPRAPLSVRILGHTHWPCFVRLRVSLGAASPSSLAVHAGSVTLQRPWCNACRRRGP